MASVGPFTKVRKLGMGAFGTVWVVTSAKTNQLLVLKEIDIDNGKPNAKEIALAEVACLKKLNHPNIISVVEYYEKDGMLNIIMQYADGGDLETAKKQTKKPFPEDQIMSWLIQIALALRHVHDNKVLHRDIKLPNIFLNKDGTVKLGDFGVARTLETTKQSVQTTIGTPYYFSPELCQGLSYNQKSDMWSFGVVIYELATLRRPFEGQNIISLVQNIVKTKHRPISGYSEEFKAIVDALLDKDFRRRPTVHQLLKSDFVRMYMKKLIAMSNARSAPIAGRTFLHRHPLAYCNKKFLCSNCSASPSGSDAGNCWTCACGYDVCDRCFQSSRTDGAAARPKITCSKCNGVIMPKERYLKCEEGTNYHTWCLVCYHCGVSVKDRYVFRGNKQYLCVECDKVEVMPVDKWICETCKASNEGDFECCMLCRRERAWHEDGTEQVGHEDPAGAEQGDAGGDLEVEQLCDTMLTMNLTSITHVKDTKKGLQTREDKSTSSDAKATDQKTQREQRNPEKGRDKEQRDRYNSHDREVDKARIERPESALGSRGTTTKDILAAKKMKEADERMQILLERGQEEHRVNKELALLNGEKNKGGELQRPGTRSGVRDGKDRESHRSHEYLRRDVVAATTGPGSTSNKSPSQSESIRWDHETQFRDARDRDRDVSKDGRSARGSSSFLVAPAPPGRSISPKPKLITDRDHQGTESKSSLRLSDSSTVNFKLEKKPSQQLSRVEVQEYEDDFEL